MRREASSRGRCRPVRGRVPHPHVPPGVRSPMPQPLPNHHDHGDTMDDYSAHLNVEHPDDEQHIVNERGPVVVNVYDGGTVHVHRGTDYWTDTDEREPDAGGIDLHDGTWQHCGYYDLSDAGSAAEFVNQLRGPGVHVTRLHAFLTDVYRRRC